MSGVLTFENLYQAAAYMAPQRFSKVSSTPLLYSKMRDGLTFENLCQAVAYVAHSALLAVFAMLYINVQVYMCVCECVIM